ncbi:hypothetical protein GGI21_003791, partial [Coemansia aciculifera]
GHQKGSEDPRSKSFLFIIDLLAKLACKPRFLLVENVAGFDKSDTRAVLLRQLARLGYRFEEYVLNPLQLSIPNSRTRYYLLAKLDSSPPSNASSAGDAEEKEKEELELPNLRHTVPGVDMIQPPADAEGRVDFERGIWHHDGVRQVKQYMETDLSSEDAEPFRLSAKVLEKYDYVMDVITPEDRRTCCFTKGYTKYAEGTGSALQLTGVVGKDPKTRENTRYFTPREVANLMGFPAEFTFPATTSNRQGYRLLGNSLSVSVVAVLMDYLVHRM